MKICLLWFLVLVTACHPKMDQSTYLTDLAAWRSQRLANLNAEDGWLSLAGLYRLNALEHTLGSDENMDVELPTGFPADFGTLTIVDNAVQLRTKVHVEIDGLPVSEATLLTTASQEGPTLVGFENYQFMIIKRGDLHLLRLRDLNRSKNHRLAEVAHFESDQKWVVPAELSEEGKGDTIVVKNIIGLDVIYVSEGTFHFKIEGTPFTLMPFGGSETYFVMLSDETTNHETYGGGRYLYVPKVDANNRTLIDFNRAENPPCVFTEFATCPLPPKENHLSVRITAGEMMMEH